MMRMEEMVGKVVCGNSLEIVREIPNTCVDAVITDPPYCSGGSSAAARQADPVSKYQQSGQKESWRSFGGDQRDQRSWGYWCSLWISQCARVLKDGGYFLMFTDWRQLPTASDVLQAGGIVWRGVIAWDKTEGARPPGKAYFRHQCEYVVWGSKGALPRREDALGPWPGCFRVPVRQSDKFHLTGKPTELMRELVGVVPSGALVLDPFAGSGTTCVAAKIEGRRFIGVEQDSGNVRIATERLDGIETNQKGFRME